MKVSHLLSAAGLGLALTLGSGAHAQDADTHHQDAAPAQTTPAPQTTSDAGSQATPTTVTTTTEKHVAPAAKTAAPPATHAAPAPAKPVAAATPPKTATLTQNSLAGELIHELNTASAVLRDRVADFTTLFSDLHFATRFSRAELEAPGGRAAVLDRSSHGLGLLLLALVLMLAPRPLLRGAMRRMAESVHRYDRRAALRQVRVPTPATAEAEPEDHEASERAAGMSAEPQPDAAEETPITDRVTPPDATTSVAEAEASKVERDNLDAAGKPRADTAIDAAAARPATIAPTPASEDDSAEARERAADAAVRAEASARRQEDRARDAANRYRTLHILRRVPIVSLRLLIELVPIVIFAALFWAGLAWLDMQETTEEVYSAIGMVTMTAWSILAILRCILSPTQTALRLVPTSDDFAKRFYSWLRILVVAGALAIVMIQWSQAIHMPARGVNAIARLMILIEHLLLAVMIWRLRKPIADRLTPPKRLRERTAGRVLAVFAQWWWTIALFFDFALWLVWAARIHDGYRLIWRLFLVTTVILVATRILGIALLGLLDRLLRLDQEHASNHPRLEARVQRYYPVLRRFISWALVVICAVALLQAWGVPALPWLGSGLGLRFTSAILSIVAAIAFGIVAYEFVSIFLERQIETYTDSGQTLRAARLRTLLPIIRSILLVVLGIIVIFTILTQIGVNVAPLLAGASIIGVAVGFGSQKLVQDFITGIFLLLENAMQVGDWVTVAGLSGTVEHLSVRTIRLRGGDGSVYIIPFSSVSTVNNINRGRGNAAVSVDIDPRADVTLASETLKNIALTMREEDAYRDGMLSDLQFWGVNGVTGTAVTLAGQIVCTDGARWAVQREFNRRMVVEFQAAGIAFARPLQIIQLLGDPATGPHAQAHAPDAG